MSTMKDLRTLLLPVIVLTQLTLSAHQLKSPILIAVILPQDNTRPFSISRVGPAIDIAVEKVQAPDGLLPGQEIEINYADSMCSSADAMNEAINFYVRNKTNIFLGPCCDYAAAPVGRQTKYWNIPIITTALARDFAAAKVDKYSLMTRLGSSINKLAECFYQILKEFQWEHLKIFYQPSGLDHQSDRMCHITAESIHFSLLDKHGLYVPYFKFETTQDGLRNMRGEIGTEHAARIICDIYRND